MYQMITMKIMILSNIVESDILNCFTPKFPYADK